MIEIKLGAWIDECRVRGVERKWGKTRTVTEKGGRAAAEAGRQETAAKAGRWPVMTVR